MALRKAIVVATHPKDHAVDLIMVDNYARFVGVQVLTASGSSRTGSNKIPRVRDRGADKWDIRKQTGQEIMATVDFIGQSPVVTGFLFPQISQMTFEDEGLEYERGDSDVIRYTDADGNMGVLHPSGAHITIGTSPDPKDFGGANFDKNLTIDRNTGNKVYLRVALAGNVAVLTMTPDGACSLHLDKTLEIECTTATIKASEKIVLDAPDTQITGTLEVKEQVTVDSDIVSTGDQIAGPGNISQINHTHGKVKSGTDQTDPPS
ncbi:hypothetical protein VPZ60_004283 [Salmonella enterica]|nr:hypothetical protein [Salmonella enterica]